MVLAVNRPNDEVYLAESTTSIASGAVTACAVSPCYGTIKRVSAAAGGTTGGLITVAVYINGGADICNGALQITSGSGARAGVYYELTEIGSGTTSGVTINEGDYIAFSPSGGTGSSIPGAFTIVVDKLS